MKNKYKSLTQSFIITSFVLLSFNGFTQTKRLSDGTVIYSDGTKKLPNGIIVYKNGAVKKGTPEILPVRTHKYSTHKRNRRYKNGNWLPPGQAKKIYGGSARDYAPGQQKKWNKGRRH